MWWFLVYDTPQDHPRISEEEKKYILSSMTKEHRVKFPVPWVKMVSSLPVWAHVSMDIAVVWLSFMLGTELPTYLKNILHYNTTSSGHYYSEPNNQYVRVLDLFVVLFKSGHSPTASRTTNMFVFLICSLFCSSLDTLLQRAEQPIFWTLYYSEPNKQYVRVLVLFVALFKSGNSATASRTTNMFVFLICSLFCLILDTDTASRTTNIELNNQYVRVLDLFVALFKSGHSTTASRTTNMFVFLFCSLFCSSLDTLLQRAEQPICSCSCSVRCSVQVWKLCYSEPNNQYVRVLDLFVVLFKSGNSATASRTTNMFVFLFYSSLDAALSL
uniref:Uncharacterized protein n=1 Tax=Timema shepardi TaxID=629360 RepID=A0A7R9B4J8_TIMSH|nr:unnamed protein product [Timema shepardi]